MYCRYVLKAVCSTDANTTLLAVNELVLIMSEEPHVSVHKILPDM